MFGLIVIADEFDTRLVNGGLSSNGSLSLVKHGRNSYIEVQILTVGLGLQKSICNNSFLPIAYAVNGCQRSVGI